MKKNYIQLDKQRELIFNLNVLEALEEKYGSIEEWENLFSSGKISVIKNTLYLALREEDSELTPDKLGKLIDVPTMMNMKNVVSQAFMEAIPEVEKTGDVIEKNVDPIANQE